MKRHNTVDEYILAAEHWHDELIQLRKILSSTDLEETIKWVLLCYTYGGKNVVGMGSFKAYFGLWFYQGALLADAKKVLVNAQEGKTKALRQWRFQSKKEIKSQLIKAYIKEAIALQEKGLEIKPARGQAVDVPPQLRAALAKNKRASAGFKALTKGKRREYADYIADAKREETKAKRIKKIVPMIVDGKGLNEKYRLC